jgi:hypothetical protein
MAGVPVPAYQQFWTDKRSALKTDYKAIANTHPDATPCMQQLFKVLRDIEDLAGYTPASVGKSEEWVAIVRSAEDNREIYSLALRAKTLCSALYGTYTVMLNEFKSLLKASSQARQSNQGDGFKEVRSQKRHSTAEAACSPKKAAIQTSAGQVPTKSFFTPFRANNMDTDAPVTVSNSTEATAPEKSYVCSQPLQLQKQLKGVAKQSFKFRSTKNRTRVVTKDMAGSKNIPQRPFPLLLYKYLLSESRKPSTAVIRHLTINTPAEDIAEGLVDISFDAISVKQMSAARRSPDGSANISLPLFLDHSKDDKILRTL